jgi:hypothetical protein
MKFLYLLLVFVPIVIGLEVVGIDNHSLMFILSALALIPLAALLGNATEKVAEFTGPKIGGLLNATLGNAAEPTGWRERSCWRCTSWWAWRSTSCLENVLTPSDRR